MRQKRNNILFYFVCYLPLLLATHSFGQYAIIGTVMDEKKDPIPNVDIYLKFSENTPYKSNDKGEFEIRLQPGEIYLIFSAWGYEDKEVFVPLAFADQKITVQLTPSLSDELDGVKISSKKANIGREVIKRVVEKRDTISQWNYPHETTVYIRTKDENIAPSDDKKKKGENPQFVEDPFGNETTSGGSLKINMLEVELDKGFAPTDKIKEKRNAYSLIGSEKNMFYQTTVKSDFNFFQNTIELPDLHQNAILSPISNPGILAYKYKLERKYEENNQTIYKIRISARNVSSSTLEGYIYVIDSLFIIQKIDLKLQKGNLLKYDYFDIHQEYGLTESGINILEKQSFDYSVKYKSEVRKINTQVVFSNYVFDKKFDKKYFSSEVSVTEKEAYLRDSSYWNEKRKIELHQEDLKYMQYIDSIKQAQNKKEYLDSVDKAFNKVTALKVLWFGIDIRNRAKRTQWTINSLALTLRPIYIAGPRVAPGFYFFKKWKNEKYVDTYAETSIGILNKDLKGRITSSYRYNPFKSAFVRLSFYHEFDAIRSYDAITQIYKRSNFIEVTAMKLTHNYEWFNGFYSTLTYEFAERRPLTNYKFLNWLDKSLENDTPTDFKTYQAGVIGLELSYTPFQKYMKEPYRKVILGSKWPIFYTYYERGIPKLFGSDVDFDYLSFGVRQQIQLKSAGTLSYHIKSGEFLSSKKLYDADKKYLRRSDPIWFSNPMYSFQKLDTLIPTIKRIMEVHVLYHDNGALLYKIPFLKKTRIGLVAGAGFAYIQEAKWWHGEVLGGLERNFKLSRRLLRIGAYYVFSKGMSVKPTHSFKISFSILDDRTMKYNF